MVDDAGGGLVVTGCGGGAAAGVDGEGLEPADPPLDVPPPLEVGTSIKGSIGDADCAGATGVAVAPSGAADGPAGGAAAADSPVAAEFGVAAGGSIGWPLVIGATGAVSGTGAGPIFASRLDAWAAQVVPGQVFSMCR